MMKTLLFAVLALAVLSLMFEAVTANNNWEQGTLGEGDSQFQPYQGDIILTTDQEQELLGSKSVSKNDPFGPQFAVSANSRRLWRDGVMPYRFNRNLGTAARNAILRAMDEFNTNTCIRFDPNPSWYGDYVEFYRGQGCYSYLGRVGGKQRISIGWGCEGIGTVIHEILHALGRWHEHSRPDRDQFVRILSSNIERGEESQFEKISTRFATTQGISYDYRSVMHYSSTAFSRNGRPTILPRTNAVDPRQLGNRRGFTSRDLQHVNTLYRCSRMASDIGRWSRWSAWSPCSRSCNGGISTRTRNCTGGTGCQGSNTQEKRCNTKACAVAARWGQWGQWSDCSHSCGGGHRVRVRTCWNGNNCAGASHQLMSCNTKACPNSGVWSQWSRWAACSQTCQSGTQRRSRVCVDRTRRQITDDCMGEGEELRSCNNGISCSGSTTSQWSVWTKCSRECGGGRRSRSRGCDNSFCEVVEEDCNTQPCSPEPALEGLSYVGCFYLLKNHAYDLLSLEGATEYLTDDYRTRTQPVRKCGQAAREYNYTTFSLVNGYCISGSNNTDAYTVFGASGNCKNGTGDVREVAAYSRTYGNIKVKLYSMDWYHIANPQSFSTSVDAILNQKSTSAASSGLMIPEATILTMVFLTLFSSML